MNLYGESNDNNEVADNQQAKSNKINLKKIKKGISPALKAKIAIIGIAIVLGFLLLYITIYLLINLGSLNSMEVALAERFALSGTKDTDYEKKILEQNEINNIIQYFNNTDETQIENHEKYFDALYDAYEFYKNDKNPNNIWTKMQRFFAKLFTANRKKTAPYYPDDTDTVMYGVTIDTSLITSSLYNSRYQADMLEEDKFSSEYSFFVDEGHKYGYDLHTGEYRDEVENTYLYDARHQQETNMTELKKAIEGIELLSKYQIKRIETYYTLEESFAGTYTDTTRHIEINIVHHDLGYCEQFLEVERAPIGPDDYYHRTTNGKYKMACGGDKRCQEECTMNLDIYDDAIYCRNNELEVDKSKCDTSKTQSPYIGKGDTGMDEPQRYELACEDFNEYLLGNLPNDEDVEMFCGYEENGTAKCYCNRFVESYYDQYVDDKDVDQKRKDISEIVFSTYSMYAYYEKATNYGNVCSKAQTNFESKRDLSCQDSKQVTYEDNEYEEDIDYDDEYDDEPMDPTKNEWCNNYADDSSYNSAIGNKIASIKNNNSLMSRIYGNRYDNTKWDCNKFASAALSLAGINYNSSAAGMFKGTKDNCVTAENVKPGDLFFSSRMDANGNCHLTGDRKDRYACVGHVGVVTGVYGDTIEITHITTTGEPAYTTTISSSYNNRNKPTNGNSWIIGFTRPY